MTSVTTGGKEIAVFGGGCFWCLDAVFSTLRGVSQVRSGYCGGRLEAPSYATVCSGSTGHAEVVEIMFDPEVISFATLLDCFFAVHDPTTLNRQGHDVGTQYRSVVFCQSESQAAAAKEAVARLQASAAYSSPIITEIAPAQPFYPAESYHQGYFGANPEQGYCSVVIAPKLARFRAHHRDLMKDEAGR
jgi:peptide-methionine (S)-S-oxide reductase